MTKETIASSLKLDWCNYKDMQKSIWNNFVSSDITVMSIFVLYLAEGLIHGFMVVNYIGKIFKLNDSK